MLGLGGMLLMGQAPAPPLSGKRIEALKPGEFLWAPQIAPEGPVMIIISLPAQKAYIYRNGVPIGVSTISSGKAGKATPTGVFTILQKEVDHKSNLYNGAPMPYMQRLTWDGIALHAGALPGFPASHGCVRLPPAFAKALFGITRTGLTVVITDRADVPEVAPVGAPLAPLAGGHDLPTGYRWQPERSAAGPLSILVSGRDRRVIVLRNGVEIGSAVIALDRPVEQTEAFTLARMDPSGPRWMRLPLPGQPAPAAPALTEEERAQGHVPDAFRRAVEAVLRPGATLLVTRESIASSGTGARVPLLEIGQD